MEKGIQRVTVFHGNIIFWFGKNELVIEEEQYENDCQQVEGYRPCPGNGYLFRERGRIGLFKPTGEHDDKALAREHSEAVGRVTDTNEEGLFLGVESQHVEPVCGDVVGGRTES